MASRLADATSPDLRAHADDPVAWFPWGKESFAEARRRDVPVMEVHVDDEGMLRRASRDGI